MINHDSPWLTMINLGFFGVSPTFLDQRLGWNQQHILCGCGLRIIPLLCWGGNPERSCVFHPVSDQWIAETNDMSLGYSVGTSSGHLVGPNCDSLDLLYVKRIIMMAMKQDGIELFCSGSSTWIACDPPITHSGKLPATACKCWEYNPGGLEWSEVWSWQGLKMIHNYNDYKCIHIRV